MNMAIVSAMKYYEEKYGSDYQHKSNNKRQKLSVLYERINKLESENKVLQFANQKALDYINSIENPTRDIKVIRDLLTIN